VVLIPYLEAGARLPGALDWKDLKGSEKPEFEQLPFDHPLWIVFSSGTSGPPKPIVHGHGGMLMNTLKSLAFEFDLRRGERFFWYTSSGWIMWNLLASSLVGGCSALLMDGHPGFPDPGALWRFAAAAKADFVGTSPAFVGVCMKAVIEPAKPLTSRACARSAARARRFPATPTTGSTVSSPGFPRRRLRRHRRGGRHRRLLALAADLRRRDAMPAARRGCRRLRQRLPPSPARSAR
jgi:acyl-CoA synthetase (AMP-forming)/AMP-acid ligase II